MALSALRASQALAGRGLLAHRAALTASCLSSQEHRPIRPSAVSIQSRNFQLPSWLWPFGGGETPTATPELAVPVEPEPVPLEVVTGFTREGAFVPVKADCVDFSPAGHFASDAMLTDLASFGLGSYWTPIGWLQHLFVYLTDHMNMPALGGLFCLVALLRLPSLPFYVKALKGAPEQMKRYEAQKKLEQEIAHYQSVNDGANAKKATAELTKGRREMMKSMIPLFMQMPIGLVFLAVRRMCWQDFSPLAAGQFLWLSTLSTPDPYLLLPVCSSGLILYLMMSNKEVGASVLNNSNKRIFMYGSVAFSSVFFCFLPAASVMVFFMNSCITLVFNSTIRSKPVANFFKIELPGPPKTTPAEEAAAAKAAAKVENYPMTVTGLRKRFGNMESVGLARFPMVKDYMDEQKQKQFLQDHKATSDQKYKAFQKQKAMASKGKLKAYRNDPSA